MLAKDKAVLGYPNICKMLAWDEILIAKGKAMIANDKAVLAKDKLLLENPNVGKVFM